MFSESRLLRHPRSCSMGVLAVVGLLLALQIAVVRGGDIAARVKRSHTSYKSYPPYHPAPPSYHHKSTASSYALPHNTYSNRGYSGPHQYGKRGRVVSYGPRAFPSSYSSHGSSYKAPPSSYKTYSVPSYSPRSSSSYSPPRPAPRPSYVAPSSSYRGGASAKQYSSGRGGFKDYSYGQCGYSDEYYGFCKERYAGHYSHPSNSDCYIQCDEWGFAYVKPCAKGTYWAHKGYGPAYYNACVAKKKHTTKAAAFSPPSYSHTYKSPAGFVGY